MLSLGSFAIFFASVAFALRSEREGECAEWMQHDEYCKQGAKSIAKSVRLIRLENDEPQALALLTSSPSKSCSLVPGEGSDLKEAELEAMRCCEEVKINKGITTHKCVLLEPTTKSSDSSNCKFRNAVDLGPDCLCPDDRPHVLVDGQRIERRQELQLIFEPQAQRMCVDDCYANYFEKPLFQKQVQTNSVTWPVVFLAVYYLGWGVVHSNLAFCPDDSIVKNSTSCYHSGADPDLCSTNVHNTVFEKGNDVPRLLMLHGCRELIYDGNHGGGIWSPSQFETGCWAQGRSARDFYSTDNDRMNLGYQKLYWLTSENSIAPFADSDGWSSGPQSVEAEMQQCFSTDATRRLDFNPGTYHLLHKNCNKFSAEVMRYLNLPRFESVAKKGLHKAISLSATVEESSAQRRLGALIRSFAGKGRAQVSVQCRAEFYEVQNNQKRNCRRVGGTNQKGDCPETPQKELMNCYDPAQTLDKPGSGIAADVGYQDAVNGICGIPIGSPCSNDEDYSPCQPGAECTMTGDSDKTSCQKVERD